MVTSACSGVILAAFDGFEDGLEVLGVGGDLPDVAVVGEVFGAGFEGDFGQLVFG